MNNDGSPQNSISRATAPDGLQSNPGLRVVKGSPFSGQTDGNVNGESLQPPGTVDPSGSGTLGSGSQPPGPSSSYVSAFQSGSIFGQHNASF